MRLLILFLILAVLVAIPFLLFEERFEEIFTGQGAHQWLDSLGSLAWLLAIALLAADLFLPVPASAVMAGLGMLYGPLMGGLIGSLGAFLAGCLAYGLCRRLGRGAAQRLAGEKDLARAERFFVRSGGLAVVLSRWLPVLPEVVACLAGLARMPLARFFTALACGSLPVAFTFSFLGAKGEKYPGLTILATALLPLILWALIHPLLGKRKPDNNTRSSP